MRVLKAKEILYFYDEAQIVLAVCQNQQRYLCVLVEDNNYLVIKNTKELLNDFLSGKVDLLDLYNSSNDFHQSFMDNKDQFICFKTCNEDLKQDWYPDKGFFLNKELL